MGWGEPAVGPNGVVHYVFAGQGQNGDKGDIFYTRSTNNGSTWSTPIKLNTDTDVSIPRAVDAFAVRNLGGQDHSLLV